MINWLKKHWEVISYLIFGVLTTLLNIVLYALFNRLFGYTAANSWGNVLDNILCILFAYATNRAFVFNSKTRGRAMAKEFGAFVTCRLGTMLLDAAIMLVLRQSAGGPGRSADGRADAGGAERGVPTGLDPGYGQYGMAASYAGTHGGGHGWLCRYCRHRRCRRPHGNLRHRQLPCAGHCGVMVVKVFSNVLVIVLNYVFSKLIIFKKK